MAQRPLRLRSWRHGRPPRVLASRVGSALAIFAVAAAFVGYAVVSVGGGDRPLSFAATVTLDEASVELPGGRLPYGAAFIEEIEVGEPCLSTITARIEWVDEGSTPLQDPFVNLELRSDLAPNLSAIAEIPAPGGSVSVEIQGAVPASATVQAATEDEAVDLVLSSAPNSSTGVGSWRITILTQAPSGWRPFVGGEISYALSATLLSCSVSVTPVNPR